MKCKCNNPDPLFCHEGEESTGVCLCKCHDVRLNKAQLEQIETYVDDRAVVGWYYGNKAQFEKRDEVIRRWLRQELRRVKR